MSELERDLMTHCGTKDCRACQTCRDRMAAASYKIERLQTLFGSRFHLDTQCGSCNGPLECDRDAICRACTDAMEVRLVFVFQQPASKTLKRGENPPYPKAGKPDADNLAKAVLDALNGLAWNDDSQVAILYVAKWVGEPGQTPGVTVTIEAIE